jgi:chemotaxis protein methyltransferase CheR
VSARAFGEGAVRDQDCVRFLQWCLPRLGLRWPGYRKVRGTVCKRVGRRLRALGLGDLDAYRDFLAVHPEEWRHLESFCRIPISRFCRDRGVFERLGREVLPALAAEALARGGRLVRCWSAGCASGEEAYSLRLVWREEVQPAFPAAELSILGTDAEPAMIERAEAACYGAGSLKDLPPKWRHRAFDRDDADFCLRPELKQGVVFRLHDIREEQPEGPFDLILCRNLAFTYFEDGLQAVVLERIDRRLRAGGYLVIGSHERLPADAPGYARLNGLPIYRKCAEGDR